MQGVPFLNAKVLLGKVRETAQSSVVRKTRTQKGAQITSSNKKKAVQAQERD